MHHHGCREYICCIAVGGVVWLIFKVPSSLDHHRQVSTVFANLIKRLLSSLVRLAGSPVSNVVAFLSREQGQFICCPWCQQAATPSRIDFCCHDSRAYIAIYCQYLRRAYWICVPSKDRRNRPWNTWAYPQAAPPPGRRSSLEIPVVEPNGHHVIAIPVRQRCATLS